MFLTLIQSTGFFLLINLIVITESRYEQQSASIPRTKEYLKEYIRQANPYQNNYFQQCIDLDLILRDIPIEPESFKYFVELASEIYANRRYFHDLLVAGDVVVLGIAKNNFKTFPLKSVTASQIESTEKINHLLSLLDNYFNVQTWEMPHYQYPESLFDCEPMAEKFAHEEEHCEYSNFYELEGACLNPALPGAGLAKRELRRLAEPVCTLQGERNFCELPSARTASNIITSAIHKPLDSDYDPFVLNDKLIGSSFILSYAELSIHDILSSRAQSNPRGHLGHAGCSIDQRKPLDKSVLASSSVPIKVDSTDPFYSTYNVSCLNFVRLQTINEDCKLRVAGTLNQRTPVLDLDTLYEKLNPSSFIENVDGQIETNKYGIPVIADVRARQTISGYTLVYFFSKLHNLIAADLSEKCGSHDLNFQIARKINIAIYQYMFFDHILGLFIGQNEVKANNLSSRYDTFMEYQEPEILSEYACGAGRACHKLIPDELLLFTEQGEPESTVPFRETFNVLSLKEDFVRQVGQGLYLQQWKTNGYSEEVTNNLFYDKHLHYGTDLLSLDLQRGRDCCLKPYIHYLKAFFGSCINTWDDLEEFMSHQKIELLKKHYKDIRAVDLLVGASLETPDGGPFGKTIKKIFVEQYRRIKSGDPKFWSRILTPAQQMEIMKLSMSDLLCIVFGYDHVVANGLFGLSNTNPLVQCRCRKLSDCFDVSVFCPSS